jgi:hypothetical protein
MAAAVDDVVHRADIETDDEGGLSLGEAQNLNEVENVARHLERAGEAAAQGKPSC